MTCSADKASQLAQTRRQVFLALFVAIAVLLHILETLMPSPLPWLKLGLANIMALTALYLYGGKAAWAVNLARIGIGALLLGRIFSPGFWLALCGALVATSVMIIVYQTFKDATSPIGVSVAGAAGHTLGQILAARLLVIQHDAIWQVMPFFLLFAVFTGILTGWLTTMLLDELKQQPAFQFSDK